MESTGGMLSHDTFILWEGAMPSLLVSSSFKKTNYGLCLGQLGCSELRHSWGQEGQQFCFDYLSLIRQILLLTALNGR